MELSREDLTEAEARLVDRLNRRRALIELAHREWDAEEKSRDAGTPRQFPLLRVFKQAFNVFKEQDYFVKSWINLLFNSCISIFAAIVLSHFITPFHCSNCKGRGSRLCPVMSDEEIARAYKSFCDGAGTRWHHA